MHVGIRNIIIEMKRTHCRTHTLSLTHCNLHGYYCIIKQHIKIKIIK